MATGKWPVNGQPSACEGHAIIDRVSARNPREQYYFKDRNTSRVSSYKGGINEVLHSYNMRPAPPRSGSRADVSKHILPGGVGILGSA